MGGQRAGQDERGAVRAPGTARALVRAWAPSLLVALVLPYLTYAVLTGWGVGTVLALVAASGWPLVEIGLFVVLHRRVDEFGVFMLVALALGLVSMVAFNSPYLVLVKESMVTGLVGLIFLFSLLLPRPLAFYLGRKFGTDGTRAGVTAWNDKWWHPQFRRAQRLVTTVWGLGFVLEAAVRIGLVAIVPIPGMVVISHVLPLVVVIGLTGWSFAYGRRLRAAARRAGYLE